MQRLGRWGKCRLHDRYPSRRESYAVIGRGVRGETEESLKSFNDSLRSSTELVACFPGAPAVKVSRGQLATVRLKSSVSFAVSFIDGSRCLTYGKLEPNGG